MMGIVEPESNRFKVALSFPGEHRDFVLKVAEELATRLTRDRVFYDEWYEIELLGVGGDLKLQSMYEQADLVVPFFSEYYSKSWCSLEWETIRGILLNRRKEDAVIPVHLDDTVISGWSTVNFGIRLRGRTPKAIADIILQTLAQRNLLNVSQQERIKELTKKLEDKERSHQSQIREKNSEIIRLQNISKSQQEKNEELTKKLEAKERSHQSQIGEKDSEITRLLEEKEKLKQSFESQIRQLAQEISRFTKQQADLQAAKEKVAEKEAIIAQLQEQVEQLKSDPKTTAKDEVELRSEKGVDYTKLRDLLAAGEWKKADEETAQVMPEAASGVINFPCEDLRTINQLWLHYSDEKFGFSIQKEIYESLGGTIQYNNKVWNTFGNRVGWRAGKNWLDDDELTFNLDEAPTAHLPTCRDEIVLIVKEDFGSRIFSCVQRKEFEEGGEGFAGFVKKAAKKLEKLLAQGEGDKTMSVMHENYIALAKRITDAQYTFTFTATDTITLTTTDTIFFSRVAQCNL